MDLKICSFSAFVCTFCRFKYSFITAICLSRLGLEDEDDVGVDNEEDIDDDDDDDDDDDRNGGCDDSDDDDENGSIIRPFLDLLLLPPDILILSKSPAL